MNILLLSSGGGGGNILRSVKALFRRDLSVTQKADARYAERLRRAVTSRFLDTNEFSLADVPREERLIIGANTTRRMGSMHNPELARQALEESRNEIEALLGRHSVVIVIATGGKGTGAGTVFPLAQIARQQKKLVIPIFVRPSFERHEVEKRRYDHALQVAERFDSEGIRLIEILNDRGYRDSDPEPQSVVWERMNLPVARALRGLLYVLWDLSQVDPSDLSSLFGGRGRLRLGFSELAPRDGQEPDDEAIRAAVRGCWEDPYSHFSGPVGTSLVCIQGDWSNVVDGKIKGQLASLALSGSADSPYNPLYARALHTPRPWGITALFAEYTGHHPALEIDWTAERRVALRAAAPPQTEIVFETTDVAVAFASEDTLDTPPPDDAAVGVVASGVDDATPPSFPTVWEFARAVNRSDPAALSLAAGGVDNDIPVDGRELKKLLGTFWFRSVFPRLSQPWRDHLLNVVAEHAAIPDHPVRIGRRIVHLREMKHELRQRVLIDPSTPEAVRADLQFLATVAALWGEEVLARFEFTRAAERTDSSRMTMLLQPFRHS